MANQTEGSGRTETQRNTDRTGAGTVQSKPVLVLHPLDDEHARGGERQARTWRIHKDRIVVGSVVTADVRLEGREIAPIHAVIEVMPREGVAAAASPSDYTVMVYDIASETGVFVNGSRVVSAEIRHGDELRIGRIRHRATLEDAEALGRGLPRGRTMAAEGRKLFVDPRVNLEAMLRDFESDGAIEEIYDYGPTTTTALEVILSWRNAILDVRYFPQSLGEVRVGPGSLDGKDAVDFQIPALLGEEPFVLARLGSAEAEATTLRRHPAMRGAIQRAREIQRLDAASGTEVKDLELRDREFAKLSVGELDFYISRTSAPPRLKSRRLRERDPLFWRSTWISLGASALLLFAIQQISVPETLEAEKLPERVATILYQPEKFAARPKPRNEVFKEIQERTEALKKPEPPKPDPQKKVKLDLTPDPKNAKKPVPKEMNVADASKPQGAAKASGKSAVGQNEAREGAGARAKGAEGARGSKTAKNTGSPQNLARRSSPQGGEGRGAGNSQVAGQGNVDLFKGLESRVENLLGNSGASLGKGGSKVAGFGGFTTVGVGGAGLTGTGSGGGGRADTLLGGLADKGMGGGRVGTGLGAAGSGSGIVGGKSRIAIRSGGPEEAVVMGSIDASAVEAALLAHKDEFRLCYEREINAENPKLAGRVGTSFVIGGGGAVTQAGVATSTLKNANVEQCILSVIRRIEFPIPRGAGLVEVTYPFKFSPTGG